MRPARPGDPSRVGPYRIIGRLGSGGMGTVHAGLTADGLRVAVKVIHPAQAEDPEFRARFRREVQLSARVQGPCLLPLLAAAPEADAPWLATAYAPGPTLNQYLADHGPLTGGTLYAFATGTAQALAAVHEAGVVHRDVKPQNVILTPAGPRVLDFGAWRKARRSRARCSWGNRCPSSS
ncbi:serine/threonine-protein kinase [Streptomyces sp. MC1]|uniref:serine/threonine-protein kinase n=1 Tax=Streptomyces sp. MC1 TaxID=295105 RepID=UPI0035A92636